MQPCSPATLRPCNLGALQLCSHVEARCPSQLANADVQRRRRPCHLDSRLGFGIVFSAKLEREVFRVRVSREKKMDLLRPCNPAALQACSPATMQPRSLVAAQRCSPAALQPCSPAALQPCSPAVLQPCSLAALQPCSPAPLHPCSLFNCVWVPFGSC